MAHEITQNDQVLLHQKAAWHGLGMVVQEELTPLEALEACGIDYGIDQWTLTATSPDGKSIIEVPSHVYNMRADKEIPMGVVSANYVPVQNRQMAEFCEALGEVGKVKVETVGTIRQGKKVWMCLKGEEFNVANGDTIFPFLLVSNGHDGSSSFRVTPTTWRAVCSNTLHMSIPREDTGQLADAAIVIRHFGKVMERIEEAKMALAQYADRRERFAEIATKLVKVEVKREDVQRFFLESYTEDFSEIPMNPQNLKEERRRNKAMSAYNSFTRRFDDERNIAGASAWNMLNAYTGLVQHDQKTRGADDDQRVERRVESNLFGLNQARTQAAFQRALAVVA